MTRSYRPNGHCAIPRDLNGSVARLRTASQDQCAAFRTHRFSFRHNCSAPHDSLASLRYRGILSCEVDGYFGKFGTRKASPLRKLSEEARQKGEHRSHDSLITPTLFSITISVPNGSESF